MLQDVIKEQGPNIEITSPQSTGHYNKNDQDLASNVSNVTRVQKYANDVEIANWLGFGYRILDLQDAAFRHRINEISENPSFMPIHQNQIFQHPSTRT